jgi:glycerol-3-phosphate dehydrogenase
MKRDFAALSSQSFDVLICGGGIYGAWTAYDAALRGLKVAVVEQNDWASATSSASTKLIHGGLRYLETFDFKLVRKSLKERTMLLHVAPHRVWPLRFGVPVFAQQRINRLQLKLGLSVYDYFAGDNDPTLHHRYFDTRQFSARFPALTITDLKGGFTYTDAQTDDARLVLELISGASTAGACCVNYCRLTQVLETNGKADAAMIRDRLTQTEYRVDAKQIVFTTGQWLANDAQSQQWCRFAKGVHLVMPSIAQNEALLLTAPSDGRVFFMIPWYGLTLLGTTDTGFTGDAEHVSVESGDIDYLLTAANSYLKKPWMRNDIIGSFAGVRVFKHSAQGSSAQSPSKISRDWELKTAPNGVHYAIGGKITSSRQDAAQIVDTVCAQLDVPAPCATLNRPFPWAPCEDFPTWHEHVQTQAVRLGVDAESAQWLVRRHGTQIHRILQRIETEPDSAQRIVPSLPFIDADLIHCVVTEMTVHLDDLLRRRLPILILAKLNDDAIRQIAQRVASPLHWDNPRIEQEIARCARYRNPS